jgi:hypothetical protein
VFGRKPEGHQLLNAKKRRMKRTSGSGGQNNGAEKTFQDQAIKRREQKKDSRIRRSKAGKENICKGKRFQDQAVKVSQRSSATTLQRCSC